VGHVGPSATGPAERAGQRERYHTPRPSSAVVLRIKALALSRQRCGGGNVRCQTTSGELGFAANISICIQGLLPYRV
jgi:hypothetical protein